MAFFNSAVTVLRTLVIALGAGLGIRGAINLLEGYGNDNPGAKSRGMKQLMAGVATQIDTSPAGFSPGVFAMIRNVSESVIIPIEGLILTFIACYELIQLIIDHNNLANFEAWIFFKWVFKTFVAVMLITNNFNIIMAVFDVVQHVINSAVGIIGGATAVDSAALASMRDTLEGMSIGPLIGVYMEVLCVVNLN